MVGFHITFNFECNCLQYGSINLHPKTVWYCIGIHKSADYTVTCLKYYCVNYDCKKYLFGICRICIYKCSTFQSYNNNYNAKSYMVYETKLIITNTLAYVITALIILEVLYYKFGMHIREDDSHLLKILYY